MTYPIETDCRTVHSLLQSESEEAPFLLDCREQDEWETARIEGAELIPMSELQERVSELNPHRSRQVVVYCHHGGRSLRVAHWLRQQGFSSAQSMAGGIDQWAQEIDPDIARY
jgi:rhodanese-related sulfurtransferase